LNPDAENRFELCSCGGEAVGSRQFHPKQPRDGRFNRNLRNKDFKEVTMKKQLITMMAVAMFVTTLTVVSVRAQNAGNVAVTIPFNFVAIGKTLPAGDYYVRRSVEGDQVVIRIQSKDNSLQVFSPIVPVHRRDIQAESKLVFNKYGDQYFLSQVWIAGRTDGQELTKTSRERLLQREMARRTTKLETIAIAGKSN
jgi:hypothetical protein